MRNNYGGYIVVRKTNLFENVTGVNFGLQFIAVSIAIIPTISHPSFDENSIATGLDQKEVASEWNTIAIVGWRKLIPERLRYNTEHGAAV
jgi:hypothetical protein